MLRKFFPLIAGFMLCLPATASTAANYTINAQWNGYTAPSGYTVSGFNLYQEGALACQTQGASATSVDCLVSLTANTTNFTLTAAFTNGTESPHSAPFVFTKPADPVVALQAVMTTNATSGTAPFTVNFNAAASTGTIASYLWNFGDGATATGSTASHAYTTSGSYVAKLTVTDSKGATSTANTTITVAAAAQQPTAAIGIEAGDISVSTSWVRVNFDSTFKNPIVVVGPPRSANSDPCVVRIKNVTSTGFDVRLYEWNYLDNSHPAETVNYLVMEKGRTTLPDGSKVEAGSFTGTTRSQTVSFGSTFTKTPVVVTTVASVNESDTIGGRLKNIGLSGFSYYFREQEKNYNVHANETVNYIAWEPGRGTIGSLQYEVATTGSAVTNSWYSKSYTGSYSQAPMVLADMQTTNNTDTSAVRFYSVGTSRFTVKIEEEKPRGAEVPHPAESVGYLVLNGD